MKQLLASFVLLSLLAMPAFGADCVEVDLEIDPILVPGEMYYFYAELTNCSDEGGLVYLTIEIDFIFGSYTLPDVPVYMAAGETFSRSVPFVLPPAAPSGDGSICVKAVKGEAEASDCAYFTIENDGGDGQALDRKSKETESSRSLD